jgi:hypothetical protein
MEEEIYHISCEDDWLDLREGEQGTMTGKLWSTLRPGDTEVAVVLPNWEPLCADIPGGYEGEAIAEGRPVAVVVTRNEDGIETSTGGIRETE